MAVIILVAYHYLFAMYSNLAYVTFILYLSSFFFFLTRISVVPLCGVEIAVFLVSSFFIIIIIPFYWVLNAEEVIDCSQFPIFA